MLLDSAEERCLIFVLQTLEKGKSKYSTLFKKGKFSHTTLQNVLKYLIGKKFVQRTEKEPKAVGYGITNKGKSLLEKITELTSFL
jgi:DNA-binding HxlR family transcriptional regulator